MVFVRKSEFMKVRKLPVVISLEEFNKVLVFTRLFHHKFAFKLGFLCGLRVSEVVNLRLDHIDLDRGFLFIKDSKGGKDRYIPIPKPMRADLKRFSSFKCVGVRALQMMFKAVSFRALNRDLHFHCLRHSCATYYLGKGMDIRQVQALLGHSNIQTTGIYLHVSQSALKDKLSEIWNE